MKRFWLMGLIVFLMGCGAAERDLRPLAAPTTAATVMIDPWHTFENSDFSIKYPAVWFAEKSAAGDVQFFDAQNNLMGMVKTGQGAELWSEGLEPFENALSEYGEVANTTLEGDAADVTAYPQEMAVLGTTVVDDEPTTVLILVISHEGRAAVISGVIDQGVERAVIEEMMESFRFLVGGVS